MADLILFMVMDEKSNKVQIIHSITDFLSLAETTDNGIKGQTIGFCSDFIRDQLSALVQVTDAAFKNIKRLASSPSSRKWTRAFSPISPRFFTMVPKPRRRFQPCSYSQEHVYIT